MRGRRGNLAIAGESEFVHIIIIIIVEPSFCTHSTSSPLPPPLFLLPCPLSPLSFCSSSSPFLFLLLLFFILILLLLLFHRQSQWWDIAPRGFEHISPLQFKAMQGGHYLETTAFTSRTPSPIKCSCWTGSYHRNAPTSPWGGHCPSSCSSSTSTSCQSDDQTSKEAVHWEHSVWNHAGECG